MQQELRGWLETADKVNQPTRSEWGHRLCWIGIQCGRLQHSRVSRYYDFHWMYIQASCLCTICQLLHLRYLVSPFLVAVDCVWGNWGPWNPCSESCKSQTTLGHGGRSGRSRSPVQEAQNGGNACHGGRYVTRPCNRHPCPGKYSRNIGTTVISSVLDDIDSFISFVLLR